MIIIHGDHTAASRIKLVEIIDSVKKAGIKIQRLEAKSLTLAQLENALQSHDLFGSNRTVVIEGLHSLPKSAQKNALITMVTKSPVDIILWEQRELTKTMLKPFSKAEVHVFKVAKTIFSWLDSLTGDHHDGGAGKGNNERSVKLFHQALQQEDVVFLFIMLARQVRLLIQVKDGGQIAGPPFMISKLKKQANTFSLDQLLVIHRKILELDVGMKTSSNTLTLVQELDLLHLGL